MSEKIPKGWKWVKLKDVIKIKHGYAFPGENITNQDTGKVLVTPGNFNIGGGFKSNKLKFYSKDYPKEYEFQGGEIIVVMTDLSKDADILGYSAKVPTDKKYKYLHNQRIGLVEIISSHVDKDFIYWLMRTTDYHSFIVGGASGTSVMHTSPDRINEYSFPLPPLPEQKAIAEVLSSIDDKIDLLHRQNKTLEKIAMTLFKQWFIEPTKDGLPEGWEERGLGEIFDYLEGPGIRNWQYSTRGIPFLNIRLIENGEINIKNANFISEEEAFGKYKKFLLQEGDVVISTSGTLGKYAIVRKYHLPLLLNTSIIRFRPKNKNYRIFMYLYLKSREFKEYLESSADGSVQANFGPTHLRAIKIIVPPSHALEKFEKIISPLYEKFDNNFFQIKSLEKLRDTLLPKLMSGEVRVRF